MLGLGLGLGTWWASRRWSRWSEVRPLEPGDLWSPDRFMLGLGYGLEFGVDVVGMTKVVALTGALVGGEPHGAWLSGISA